MTTPTIPATPFERTCRALRTCQGYTLDLMSLSIIEEAADDLQVRLRWGPGRPDITLALRGIYHLNLNRAPATSAPVLGQIKAIPLLPFDVPWPPGVTIDIPRSADLPPLLWIHCPGPLQLDTVSAVATLHTETS